MRSSQFLFNPSSSKTDVEPFNPGPSQFRACIKSSSYFPPSLRISAISPTSIPNCKEASQRAGLTGDWLVWFELSECIRETILTYRSCVPHHTDINNFSDSGRCREFQIRKSVHTIKERHQHSTFLPE
ncbi:hypothetical protein CEXT_441171 [Caerostris extrusa]|uniref:Uncharacterized protein n=1 Tax=Caerostris extrusa TaxID=172846 RepID=A0AAV4XIJ4_CAEEX|nr:hypothetical protein CEXT_441171 [Caerostris extrusa]